MSSYAKIRRKLGPFNVRCVCVWEEMESVGVCVFP
jgi:hypothetical protein